MTKIVSIHSFRGGTGKSNTTANIASLLAMKGKRVAMVDTDIQSPGIHVLFGLDEKKMGHTLNEYLHGQVTIEEVAYKVGDHIDDDAPAGRAQLKGKDLWLVPSSINGKEIKTILHDGFDFNVLNKGFQTLRKKLELDYLLIDTHPGLNDETLLSVAISDTLIIILRPDQQDFQGTAVTVDVARSLDVPNLVLVVNKALSKYDFKQMREDISATYGAPVAGILPLSEDMVDNASSDIFSLAYPDHPWSKAMMEIVDNILAFG